MKFLDRFFLPSQEGNNGNGLILPAVKKNTFNVLLAVCAHRGIDPESFERLMSLAFCPDPKIYVKIKAFDALIDRSRSIVASRFLERKEYDVLMFIDDDIIFEPKDVSKICKLVYENELGIVGGAYAKKTDKDCHLAIQCSKEEKYVFGINGACQEVEFVSTGFMAIKRRALQDVAEKIPYCHPEDLKFYPFFQPIADKLSDGRWVYLSEDWAFCKRIKDCGWKIYIDTTTKLGHAGRYVYTPDDMLRPPKDHFKSITYWEENFMPRVFGEK